MITSTGNRIIDALPPPERAYVLPLLTPLWLGQGQRLHRLGEPITHACFPRTASISLLVVLRDGRQIEVAAIGREGFLGPHLAMGVGMETLLSLAQVPGEVFLMEATAFQNAVAALPGLRHIVASYGVVLFTHVAQSAACNAFHSVRERCARWLLEVRDGVGANEFPLTQQFLADMLGVYRPSVTAALRSLERAGLITCHRGRIAIRDQSRLEAAACECYRFLADETHRMLRRTANTIA